MARPTLRALPAAIRVAALAAVVAAGGAVQAVAETSPRAELLRDLSSEAAATRQRAARRLEAADGVTAGEVVAALRTADARGRALLYRVAAVHGLAEAVPSVAEGAAGADAPAAEAALRALVKLGPAAVEAGRAALSSAPAGRLSALERDARLAHLTALDAQARVEQAVFAKWRRKGGSYRGRYAELRSFGWEVQPVLLAMLLDVPVEDQFVAVAETGDADRDREARRAAVAAVARSRRRGYRTFEPLPERIEKDEVFSLAQQALCDIGDVELLEEPLREVHAALSEANQRLGWAPQRWEEAFAEDIEVVLSYLGRKDLLEARYMSARMRVDRVRLRIGRRDPDEAASEIAYLSQHLSELAEVLHQLERFDEAAARYAELIAVSRRANLKAPAIAGYNRACALARGGRVEEALAQLDAALDPSVSFGQETLTREWVVEDGDLERLHADPRFARILKRRYGH